MNHRIFHIKSELEIINNTAKILDSIELPTKKFPNGEFFVSIPVHVRNQSCYLIAEITPENIFHVCLTVDTLKRSCADKVTLISPYLPYSRQDRRVDIRTPMSAKVLANILQTSGVDHIITVDVHALQIECFYEIPFDNLQMFRPLYNRIVKENCLDKSKVALVSPDAGASKKVGHIATSMGTDFAMFHKQRFSDTEVQSILLGNIKGKHCIILDDIVSTGSTMLEARKVLIENGALSVFLGCSHMLSSDEAIHNKLENLYYLNTVQNENQKSRSVDISSYLANTIYQDINGESISSMFE